MIKGEIYKLFKIKAIAITLCLVIITVIYSMAVYGEFGYDLSSFLTMYSNNGMIAYSEENGMLLKGQEGYEKNKKVATLYAGEVDELFLRKMHSDYKIASYIEGENGERFYNSTYSFFRDVFNIESENYATVNDLWGNMKETIKYGFTGDWDAYGNIIHNFFFVYSFFVITFSVPIFTYDRECYMTDFLSTVEKGGRSLLKHKIRAAFCTVNFLMFIMLAFISIVHFMQYGFTNADVSIQCSFEQKYVGVKLYCTMIQLVIIRLLFGILGCNMLMIISLFISMLSKTTLTALAISLVITWMPSYSVIQLLSDNHTLNLFFTIIPINCLYITNILNEISTWNICWRIVVIRFLMIIIMCCITKLLWKKYFFILSRRE